MKKPFLDVVFEGVVNKKKRKKWYKYKKKLQAITLLI